MFGSRKKNRDQHRYYLLPGMGKCNRRKHGQFLRISLVVGVLVSGAIAAILYVINQ